MDHADIVRLERIMLATWPPLETAERAGWVLGASAGFTGRANSLTVLSSADDQPAEDLISWMEGWYSDRDLPPAIRVTPISAAIGTALEARGFVFWKNGADVMVGPLEPLTELGEVDGYTATGSGAADQRWYGLSGHDESDRAVLTEMFDGVAPRSLHVTVNRDGEAAAIGRGVVADGHLAIYGMETAPAHRRRGLARSVIGALARWAADQGATSATLQVEVGNDGAHSLYEAIGLRDAYEYSYLAKLD